MKICTWDKKEKKILYESDILFGLGEVIVEKVYSDTISETELEKELLKRAYFENSYEMDEIVLKELDLYEKKHLFGRMNEACVLRAMLKNFEIENSDIIFFPKEDKLISFQLYDSRYSNIYLWRSLYETDA